MPAHLDFDALLRLWTEPLPAGDAALDAIKTLYTDPVKVNGNWLTAADLVARATEPQSFQQGAGVRTQRVRSEAASSSSSE